uniref:(northern house mosquito) hypothetical protein n=1 Tax=Culex pipiens TaxID=7175 RepID=A0A8D8PIK0_CULPI
MNIYHFTCFSFKQSSTLFFLTFVFLFLKQDPFCLFLLFSLLTLRPSLYFLYYHSLWFFVFSLLFRGRFSQTHFVSSQGNDVDSSRTKLTLNFWRRSHSKL